ncbi:hypothetical protein QE152_g32494 [Popillia japonica]|uniref:Uncharacterized protein n=1 Tax=Popillia japonica TaxID=7064 RepID=A0AAW1IZ56_POPJA
MEDIAFGDWPGQPMDLAGSNPWLPAYGYQPPTTLLEKEDFLGHPEEVEEKTKGNLKSFRGDILFND